MIPHPDDETRPEVDIREFSDRSKYLYFWKERFEKLDTEVKRLTADGHFASIPRIELEKIQVMREFVNHVIEILTVVQDRLQPRKWEVFIKYGFNDPITSNSRAADVTPTPAVPAVSARHDP